MLYRLVAEGRYMQDIFTTYTGPQMDKPRVYPSSEIVCHNDDAHGYWQIIDGRVYDVTEFAHLHVGGRAIISAYAGLDATHAYRAVQHHLNSEVDAMLGMYELGYIRRLNFGQAWTVVVESNGLRYLSLEDAFRLWVRFLYLIVEMENALANDYSFLRAEITDGVDTTVLTPYKIQLVADVHRGFVLNYFRPTLGDELNAAWVVAAALCAPAESIERISLEGAEVLSSQEFALVESCSDAMYASTTRLLRDVRPQNIDWEPLRALCARLHEENRRFLSEVKAALQEGVRSFERHEAAVARDGALLAATLQVPAIARSYCARLCEAIHAIPGLDIERAGDAEQTQPSASASLPLPGHGMASR
jgi:sulfite reductase (NADPH) flavoprotein alpha-component